MPLTQAVTQRRRQTRSSIYQYLYRHTDFCSKQTVAQDMGLSLPTVYQNLTELMDAGLIRYSGEQRSTGGRKAMGLDIVPDARLAIGISITDTRVRLIAADLRLQELGYRSIRQTLQGDMTNFSALLSHELEDFLEENHIDRSKLLGVGIALPGTLNAERDLMVMAPTLHMQNVPLDQLRSAIPYPIWVQNDGTCGGYAEWFVRTRNGTTDNNGNMAYLSLENGVGGSLMLGGKLYDGDHFRSGEFGHMKVETHGLTCRCGKVGCLEAYCSARRISDDLGLSLEEFFAAIEDGNASYAALWQDILLHLATGINNISMAMDCNVVLGGFLSEYLRPWLPQLRKYVAQGNTFTSSGDFVDLSQLNSHSVPLGAALYYIKQFIDTI